MDHESSPGLSTPRASVGWVGSGSEGSGPGSAAASAWIDPTRCWPEAAAGVLSVMAYGREIARIAKKRV